MGCVWVCWGVLGVCWACGGSVWGVCVVCVFGRVVCVLECVLGCVLDLSRGEKVLLAPLYYPDTLVNPDTCLGISN